MARPPLAAEEHRASRHGSTEDRHTPVAHDYVEWLASLNSIPRRVKVAAVVLDGQHVLSSATRSGQGQPWHRGKSEGMGRPGVGWDRATGEPRPPRAGARGA